MKAHDTAESLLIYRIARCRLVSPPGQIEGVFSSDAMQPISASMPGWRGVVTLGERQLGVVDGVELLGLSSGAPGTYLLVLAGLPLAVLVDSVEGVVERDALQSCALPAWLASSTAAAGLKRMWRLPDGGLCYELHWDASRAALWAQRWEARI